MVAHSALPPSSESADVLVIGGGPAGSSAATVLAERGHRAVNIRPNEPERMTAG